MVSKVWWLAYSFIAYWKAGFSWLIKLDIHSAYHYLDIFKYTTFIHNIFDLLGFSVKKVYILNFWFYHLVLCAARYRFTKLIRPLIKKWRDDGLQILMYLDDGHCHNTDKAQLVVQSSKFKCDIISSGFVPKADKSMWDPVQCMVFLGLNIDTSLGVLRIPEHRIEKAHACLLDILKDDNRGTCRTFSAYWILIFLRMR